MYFYLEFYKKSCLIDTCRVFAVIKLRKGLIFLLILILYALTVNYLWVTPYVSGAINLAEHLLRGSMMVDSSTCDSVDHVLTSRGCIYAGPLGLALLLIPSIMYSDSTGLSTLTTTGFAMAVTGALAVYFSTLLYRELGSGEKEALAIALINGLAGPIWIYSTHVFPQAPLALFYILLMYSIIKIAYSGNILYSIVAGLSFSILFVLDPSTLITNGTLLLITLYYLLKKQRMSIERIALAIVLFTITARPLIEIQLLYNYTTTGSPFTFPEQLYLEKIGIKGVGFNPFYLVNGLYILLIDSRKSLLALYPFYLLALIYMPRALKQLDKYIRTILLVSTILPILLYASWYDPDGGLSYGPRFLVPLTPLIAYPLVYAIKNRTRIIKYALLLTAFFSLIENIVVVMTTPYPDPLEGLKPGENQFFTSELKFYNEGIRSALIYGELVKYMSCESATIDSFLILSLLLALITILYIKENG